MIKKILILGVALIMGTVLFARCVAKTTEQAKSGAYFAMGNGGEYAVIYDNYLSLYWDTNNNRFDVFEFSRDGNSYVGENLRAEISFKVSGDNLTITLKSPNVGFSGSKKIRLKRDSSKVLSEEEPIQLETPKLPLGGEGQSSLFMRQNGYLGADIEIKRPGSEDFVDEMISDYIPEPACFFDISFKRLNLTQGLNVLRVTHIGGPFIQSDNKIRLSENSDSICFNLTVDSEGNVITLEIQE